nr:MAG TPA: hypothetical protein [Caudoviricetes sp.]
MCLVGICTLHRPFRSLTYKVFHCYKYSVYLFRHKHTFH